MIEVDATPRQRLGMPPVRFLREYWQKRPLLIRGAFPHFHNAITPEDLAGLACEEAALARIVVRGTRARYSVRNGPFAEGDFARLPKTRWTLLVQDVDKWDMDVAALLDAFDFVPSWRIDDVMVSYATDGGGVGPHVDNYDVFLVQGRGRRRWRISVDPEAPKEFRADAELKLLRRFAPTHDWVLETGDTLYLPPGVPHEGTALGECTTFSIGMRAPSRAELLFDLAEFLAEPLREEDRYTDPDLAVAAEPGEIDRAALARVRRALPPGFGDLDATALRRWFGAFITRYRVAHEAAAATRRVNVSDFARRLRSVRLLRHPWTRMAWVRVGNAAELYVAGTRHSCSIALAKRLTAAREIAGAEFADSARGDLDTLTALVNGGHLRMLASR